MKKFFLSLVALLMGFVGAYAQTTVNFTEQTVEETGSGFTLSVAPFTFTATKNDGATAPVQNSKWKDIRVYAKGSLTVASDEAMTEMVFKISTAGQKRLTEITPSTGKVAVDTENWTVTWTGDASEVTFTVGEKATYGTDGSSKAGQFDVDAVTITSAPVAQISANINIAFPNIAIVTNAITGEEITLASGDNTISVPANKNVIRIVNKSHKSGDFMVLVNGQQIEPTEDAYTFTVVLTEGMTVTIADENTPVTSTVHIDFPSIANVTTLYNGETITLGAGDNNVTVPMMDNKIRIENKSHKSGDFMVLVNGEQIEADPNSPYTFTVALEEGMTVRILDENTPVTATINIADPSIAYVCNARSQETISLKAVYNQIIVPMMDNKIRIDNLSKQSGDFFVLVNGQQIEADKDNPYSYTVALEDGMTVQITDENALASIIVDNVSKVKVTDENRNVLSLQNGTQILAPGNYMISSTVPGYLLAGVTIDGATVQPMKNATYWMVSVEAGQTLNIKADYDEASYMVFCSDAAAVKSVTVAGTDITEQGVPNMNEFDEVTSVVYFVPAGYKVVVALNEGYTTTDALSFYATEDHTITTTKVTPTYATVIVDNVNKVKMINENYVEQTLVSGSQQFSAGNYMITSRVAGYTLNKVELNGTELKAPYGYYQVSLEAGDELVITADYTPANSKVLFELPYRKNTADVVKTVAHSGGATIEGWPTGMFEAANGYKMTITLDETNYVVDSVLVNGVKVRGSYGVYTTSAIKEYTDVEIFALPVETLNAKIVVVNVPDMTMPAEYVSAHRGGSAYGEEISLRPATNKITVPSNNNKIVLVPASGKTIYVAVNNTLIDADATTGYYTIAVNEGDEIKIAPEIEFTSDPADGATVDAINNVVFTFPGFEMSGADCVHPYDNYKDAVRNANGEVVCDALLTWGNENNQLSWTAAQEITEAGTYTITIPAGELRFGDVNIQPITITLTVKGTPAPSINFVTSPAAGSTVESIKKVVITFPDYALADFSSWMLPDCIKNEAGESLGAATLSYADAENALTWEYGSTAITEAGTYTITIPAGAILLGDGETMDPTTEDIVFTLTVGEATAPVLQATYPQANTTVNVLPDYVTFMFDQEVNQPYAVAIQNGYQDPIIIDPTDYKVIDGNTVYITLTEKTKEALGTTGKDGVTVYVQLTESLQYDTHFTVAPEFAIVSSEFTSTGGKLYFNDNVDFVDYATEVKCYVSGVKTRNIATQATLTLDDEEYNVINVTFADELEAGDYTLDIEDGQIMSTSEEPLASVKVPFTIEESSVLICTFDATPKAGYEDYCGKAIFEEWSDKVVIKSYDGTEGHDLTITWDENGYNAINGEASPWVYISNGKYYGAYLYTYDDWSGRNYTGGNWTSEGGEFWIGGYFYENYDSYGDWSYMYWDLTPQGTGVNSIKQSTDSQDGKYFINGKVVIVKNGKKFTVNGARM